MWSNWKLSVVMAEMGSGTAASENHGAVSYKAYPTCGRYPVTVRIQRTLETVSTRKSSQQLRS